MWTMIIETLSSRWALLLSFPYFVSLADVDDGCQTSHSTLGNLTLAPSWRILKSVSYNRIQYIIQDTILYQLQDMISKYPMTSSTMHYNMCRSCTVTENQDFVVRHAM